MDAGCDFVACDNPHATRLTIHILAAVAEEETRAISIRTKAALKAAKARGVKLGSDRPGHWKGHEKARLDGLARGREIAKKVRHESAIALMADLVPEIQKLRIEGHSFASIATVLTERGHETARGCAWSAMAVKRVLDMADADGRSGTK